MLPRTSGVCCSAADAAPGEPGHLFVIHGDVRQIMADAVLYPTRRASNPKWFPDGLPDSVRGVEISRFSKDSRVHPVLGTPYGTPEVWLSWVLWEDGSEPPIEWYTRAAEQFLHAAYRRVCQRGPPICERELPLLALPVIGTGATGAKPRTGFLLSALLLVLTRFVSEHAVDVVLVTKTSRMFSAAQSARRGMGAISMDICGSQ